MDQPSLVSRTSGNRFILFPSMPESYLNSQPLIASLMVLLTCCGGGAVH
jgi:hypothetical protein